MTLRLSLVLLLPLAAILCSVTLSHCQDQPDRDRLLEFIDGRRTRIVRTGAKIECPFRYPTRPTIEVRLGGRDYDFLLDSGTRLSVLKLSGGSVLPAGLESVSPAGFLADLDGNRKLDYGDHRLAYAEAALVSCGSLRIRNLPLRVYQYDSEIPGDYSGSLSLHSLQPYVVSIDNDDLMLRLHDAGEYAPSPKAIAVPLQQLHNLVLLRAMAGNQELLLALDTGFSGGLLLDSRLLETDAPLELLGRASDQSYSGFHGDVSGEAAVLQELKMASQPWPGLAQSTSQLNLVEVTILEGLAQESTLGSIDGILGAGLLARFNYAVDLSRGVLFLEAR